MNWHERLKAYKKATGHKNSDIAKIAEMSEGYVRKELAPGSKRDFPKWAKIIIKMWEENKAIDIDHSQIEDIEFEGIDPKDYPDFADAYISRATYKGREMTEDEIENIDGDFFLEKIYEHIQ